MLLCAAETHTQKKIACLLIFFGSEKYSFGPTRIWTHGRPQRGDSGLILFLPRVGSGPPWKINPSFFAIWVPFCYFSPCEGFFAMFFTLWGGGAFLPCEGPFYHVGAFLLLISPYGGLFYFMGGFFELPPLRKLLLAPMLEPMTFWLMDINHNHWTNQSKFWFRKNRFTRIPITRWTHDFLVDLEDLAICMHRCDFTNSVPRNMSVHTGDHAVITWGDEHNLPMTL